jgi:hypothetical protein
MNKIEEFLESPFRIRGKLITFSGSEQNIEEDRVRGFERKIWEKIYIIMYQYGPNTTPKKRTEKKKKPKTIQSR